MTTNSERTHDVVDDWSASFSALRLIKALQRARVDEVCSVLADRKSAKSALLVQGNDCGPSRRTPLMHAVQTGKLSIVTSVMQAFDSLFSSAKHRALEMKKQLLAHDAEGWTVAMLATRAGNVAILMAILEEMIRSGPFTPPDSRVTLLRMALSVIKTCLRKPQARQMLSWRDVWERTLVSHALLSGSPKVFFESVSALRVLGAEAVKTRVEDAVNQIPWGQAANMRWLAQQQLQLLQDEVEFRANDSSLAAKINSFCPVKLLLVFHLTLPAVSEGLVLLLVMASLAPLIEWAQDVLLTRETPREPLSTRSNGRYLLAFPAMFVWGAGTSGVLQVEAGLFDFTVAVMLAVGAIIIPAADIFFNTLDYAQWMDQLRTTSWEMQEERRWKDMKTKAEMARENERHLLSKGSTSFVRDAYSSEAVTPTQLADRSDVEAAMEPADLVVAGDDWEVLAKGLQAGERYVSEDGDVRLQVQPGSLSGPVTDFVKLHLSTQLLKSKGRNYITDTIVHCPPNVEFQDPLLLDFLLGDPAISGGKGVLAEVLQKYQVLRKNAGAETWEPMEEKDMELVDEAGATYLRAHIYHFTGFCKGKVSDVVSGVETDNENTNEQGFTISNATDKVLYLVRVPFRFARDVSSRRQATFNLGISVAAGGISAGPSGGGGFEREARTEWVFDEQTKGVPLKLKIMPKAKRQMLYLMDKAASERLMVFVVEDEPYSNAATPVSATPAPATPTSPSSLSQPAPATGTPVDVGTNPHPSQIQVLRYLGDHVMLGKGGLIYTQEQVAPRAWLSSARVDTHISSLLDVAMALAGLSEKTPAPAPAPAPQRNTRRTFFWF
eukprot:g14313.t1